MVFRPIKEISFRDVRLALGKMKSGKAMGPSGVIEMLTAAGDVGVQWMVDLCNVVVKEGKVPDDWSTSWIVSVYKGKGDAKREALLKFADAIGLAITNTWFEKCESR